MSFKKCKAVMLPTNEKAKLGEALTSKLYKAKEGFLELLPKVRGNEVEFQHLYILSDEEIEEGDWVNHKEKIYKVRINKGLYLTLEGLDNIDVRADLCKKIIATTDKSLTIDGYDTSDEESFVKLYLPQPSQSFVEKFVEEYNKGNVITEVLVEYESIGAYANPKYDSDYQLKINPKNNTITIRKVKSDYSREEVEALLHKATLQAMEEQDEFDFWKFVEENL